MSAVLAAMREAEREENKARPFLLLISMRYGREVRGSVWGELEAIRQDGGVCINIWLNGEETEKRIYLSCAEVLWCEIEWLD